MNSKQNMMPHDIPRPPDMQNRLLTIVKASRPAGWTFGPILFCIGLLHSKTIPRTIPSLLIAGLQIFAYSFPLCTIIFGVNDIYDYESDLLNPRKIASGLEGTILAPVYHADVLNAAYISTAFIFLSSLLTHQRPNIIATCLILILGWQYSSPPLRLKEVPVVDSLSNGCIVLLAYLAGFSWSRKTLHGNPNKGYILALCTAGIHALGAVVDVEADVAAGQRTIAVALGKRFAAGFAMLCYVVALATVQSASIFKAYICGGLLCMLASCMNVNWAHRCFQAIIYWSIGMAMIWFAARSRGAMFKS